MSATDCILCATGSDHPRGHWCPGPAPSPADRIRARLSEKRDEYENFQGYLAVRTREEDLHGIWDAGINMSEVANYIDGLLFCLQAMGEKET